MLALKLVAAAVIGYLLGNISFGIILSRLFGHIDIRRHGSGNAGTTNVLRTLGWLPSILTLIGDALKAWGAARLGYLIAGDPGLLIGGLCAVLGHNWPIFLGLRGGKGIAPTLGMIIAINPCIAILLVVGQFLVVGITGYMSLASLISACMFPVWVAVFMHSHSNFVLFLMFALLSGALAIYSHRANIRRLLQGNENKLEFNKIHFMEKIREKRKNR